MIPYTCHTCGKRFYGYKYRDGKYCSTACFNISLAGNHNSAKRSEKVIHYKNVCLGKACREKKSFITDNKFNRLCPRCSVLIQGCADVGV